MTVGIALLCRYDSKRLPGKILAEINGRPLISHIIDRIRRGAPDRPLVVTTSAESSDDPIAHYCRRAGVSCFRGSLNDVADRFLNCINSNGWDFGVRINGDNLFLDPHTLYAMLAIADTDQFDFITNVPGRTFPYGMSVEIVRSTFYDASFEEMTDESHREHVTSWLYDNPMQGRRYVYRNTVYPEAAGLELAIDTHEDLDRARRILDRIGSDPFGVTLKNVRQLADREQPTNPWQGVSGPLLIAEIGGNHEGNFDVAKEMCRQAIGSGADCVKFQLYRGDTLVSPVESPQRHRHFQTFELTREQHIDLAKMCREANVTYTASVWDLDMLEWIDPYLDFYKIGSGDLTAWPILEKFARRGKPILLSTGLATMDEVLQTVAHIQRVDKRYEQPEMLCVMQCTSMYPIPDRDANLRVMEAFRAQTGLAVGYSDHTVGSTALLAAAAMGAAALEFHFTDSREGKEFRDHKVSLTAKEVDILKDEIRGITTLRGGCVKIPQPSELEEGHEISFRRGAYVRRSILAGEAISDADVVLLRPAEGTDARDSGILGASRALRDLEAFQAIRVETDYTADKLDTDLTAKK